MWQYTVEFCAGGINTGITNPPSSADAVVQNPGGQLNVGGPSGSGGGSPPAIPPTQGHESSTSPSSTLKEGPHSSLSNQHVFASSSTRDAPSPIVLSSSSSAAGSEDHDHHGKSHEGGEFLHLGPNDNIVQVVSTSSKADCRAQAKRTAKARLDKCDDAEER